VNGSPPPNPAGTLSLADFTCEGLIIPELAARAMPEAILELSEAFHRVDARWDAEKLNRAALERERRMSTAMDFGAAFPHSRFPDCVRLQFGLGRAAEPFPWGPGLPRVQFVFLNAVPANDAMGYLKLVSGMARLANDPALWGRLKAAGTAKDFLDLLGRMPVRK
jgi:mannitol/fructose-specific phosphotransferase system IIA component (Ntr-type)